MVVTNEIGSVRNTLFHKHERKERESILKRLSAGCKTPFSEELVSMWRKIQFVSLGMLYQQTESFVIVITNQCSIVMFTRDSSQEVMPPCYYSFHVDIAFARNV
jgi:hypothetical protein